MGIAYVIHQMPIHRVAANTILPSKDNCCSSSPIGIMTNSTNSTGPKMSPILLAFFLDINLIAA